MATIDQAPLAPGRPPLLSVRGAAEFLDVSDSTVRRLVRAGDLQPLRVGVQLRFDQEELERYAATRGDRGRNVGLPSDAMAIPPWAADRIESWKRTLDDLLPDPKQSEVVVIDRRGAKAFSMLRPDAFQWGVNLWHSTALCLQSDAELRKRFDGKEIFVFDEMVQRGRDVERVRERLDELGLQARSIALIRRRAKFVEGKVADPHLYAIEDLDEQDYLEAAAFISRLFDYCEPPLDPEHVLVSGELTEPVTADQVRGRLEDSGVVGVVWNRQSIEDSLVAAVTIDRPQFFDISNLPLPDGFDASWDGPCKIRIYLSADGRRVTLSFITFPTLTADKAAWQSLVDRSWLRYGADSERAGPGSDRPSVEELERAYVDVCTDLSVDLLRQAVLAGVADSLGMNEVRAPRQGELAAFFGPTRGSEMRKQVNDALQADKKPQLRLPPKQQVPLFIDIDRPMSRTTDPEHAQRCIVEVLPSKHAPTGVGQEPPDSVKGIGYLELLKRLRPLEEVDVSNGLDGLLDGVRAKPVNVIEATNDGWKVKRGFVGSEIGPDGAYDAREMRRAQAISLVALRQWLSGLGKRDETEIHVAKLLVNLVHDWGGGARRLTIEPYPYKHGYMPGVDSKVPWRTEAPRYFLHELAAAGMVVRRREGPTLRYAIPGRFDLDQFAEDAELSGHERSQLKSLVRAYTLVQERCKVRRRRDPSDEGPTGQFSDPLIVLSSARNEQIAYACALFEIEDWVRIGRRLFETLGTHVATEPGSVEYRRAIDAQVLPFAQAARFLFEKIAMYQAVPELRQQLVELFDQAGVDAGDILLETIDREARFAQSYEESDYPVGLLRTALPVVRGFSNLLRMALCQLDLQEDTRAEKDRQTESADGTTVNKDVGYYADKVIDAANDPSLTKAIKDAVTALDRASGRAGEAAAIAALSSAFELIVTELNTQVQTEEDLGSERRRKDERYGDLIEVARRLERNSQLQASQAVVAVGDFYNFMNVIGKVAEVTGASDTDVAAGLQDRMGKVVEKVTKAADVIAHISSDTCVLAANDADGLLAAVEEVNEAFLVELSWDRDLAEFSLSFMRFGIATLEAGACLDAVVTAMKLAEKRGFGRGSVTATPAAHGRLGPSNARRCVLEVDEEGREAYRLEHSQELPEGQERPEG